MVLEKVHVFSRTWGATCVSSKLDFASCLPDQIQHFIIHPIFILHPNMDLSLSFSLHHKPLRSVYMPVSTHFKLPKPTPQPTRRWSTIMYGPSPSPAPQPAAVSPASVTRATGHQQTQPTVVPSISVTSAPDSLHRARKCYKCKKIDHIARGYTQPSPRSPSPCLTVPLASLSRSLSPVSIFSYTNTSIY